VEILFLQDVCHLLDVLKTKHALQEHVITAFVNILTLWSEEASEVIRINIVNFLLVSDSKNQVLSSHHI